MRRVTRPGQYLGNEWGSSRRSWESASVHLALAFPDLYELGMSNFGQRILYQVVNSHPDFMADRSYHPAADMEELLRQSNVPLWGWESRRPLADFELLGFSLTYELTYTNVLNMLDLACIPVLASDRHLGFPLVFGGGPSAVNPEPMALFMDFFIIGDGESTLRAVMELVHSYKDNNTLGLSSVQREDLLCEMARSIPGVYVPRFYESVSGTAVAKPMRQDIPERIVRQVEPLTNANQPPGTLTPYLSLVHDRQVLEVRRGCDRGCRFCQPGYTFLPVRERSTQDLVKLSRQALNQSGYEEYSLLSLCVSDYTGLREATRALNDEHAVHRVSMSFPSQRADRMNFDIAGQLKVVRRSGITLAPEAGTERLRGVINKGLRHNEIMTAIETAYQSGWAAVKLYFMLGLPTETDEDLSGIIGILKEATERCAVIRKANPTRYRRNIEFTCTISNFVPKPFTPFQWVGQISPDETIRRQNVLKGKLKELSLKNVILNFTCPEVSLLEAVISRGNRAVGEIIYRAWQLGCKFDAWDEKLAFNLWDKAASSVAEQSLKALACSERDIGMSQPWEIVHVGLNGLWLENEWKKAMSGQETSACTESPCHGCGICTQLDATHLLASPKLDAMSKNLFVRKLGRQAGGLQAAPTYANLRKSVLANVMVTRIRFEFTKTGELRFISHLDLQHLLARAARRAQLSLVFSQGFHPSPMLSLAVPLPLFEESVAEIGEMALSQAIAPDEFVSRLNSCLPPEVQVMRAKEIQTPQGKTAVASVVAKALYQSTPSKSSLAHLYNKYGSLGEQKIAEQVASVSHLPALFCKANDRESTGKQTLKDIKPGVFSLTVLEVPPLTLEFQLATGSNLHVRPADLLGLIEPEIIWRVTRLSLATADGIPLFDFLEKGAL